MNQHIDYISFEVSGISEESQTITHIMDICKTRVFFWIDGEKIGYIDYQLTLDTGQLMFFEIFQKFRGIGWSSIIMDQFLSFLKYKGISLLWTEGYTKLGKETRYGKTFEQAISYNIEYIDGIQRS